MNYRLWIFTGWAATRLILPLIGYLAYLFLVPYPEAAQAHPNWLMMWDRFDSMRYLEIAQRGYFSTYVGPAGYFPGYPLLFKIISLGSGQLWAALLVSNLAFLGGLFCLYHLLLYDLPEPSCRRILVLVLVFPTAFLSACVYSESTFFLFTTASILAVRKGWWKSSVSLGCYAALTRPTGVLLAPVLLWERWKSGSKSWPGLGLLALLPLTVVGFFGYLEYELGNFWLYHKTQTYLADFLGVGSHLMDGRPLKAEHYVGLGFLALEIVVVLIGWTRMRGSYRIYVALSMFMALYHTQGLCTHRFMLVLFPLFIVAEQRTPKRFYPLLVLLSLLGQWLLFALWVRGYRTTY